MRIYIGAVQHDSLLKDKGDRTDLYIECPGCKTRQRLVDFYPTPTRPMSCGSINAMRLIQFIGNFSMEHSGCPNE